MGIPDKFPRPGFIQRMKTRLLIFFYLHLGIYKGQHSIRINDQWRVCLRWQGEDALDVEIVDYH
jgi:plasmid maintenance system killer protein